MDECAAIGAGWRHVEVTEIGPVIVKLRYTTSAGTITAELGREAWDHKMACKSPPIPVGPPVPIMPLRMGVAA
jgi:hypothetical protein